MQLSPGYILRGRYEIIRLAGSGGMGNVYQARDKIKNRDVAIKQMIQKNLNTHDLMKAQERFQKEADLLRNLSHPNLPHVYESFIEQGNSYLVMDFIDGKNLDDITMAQPTKQLPVDRVIAIAIELCNVLAYLHSRPNPIIYRDLKPTNVMISNDDHVYLIDFGIARVFKQGQLMDTEFFGSLGFCPPEQLRGEEQTDASSDIFSLGATLYYCLTGNHPKNNKPTLFNFAPLSQNVPPRLNMLLLNMVATDKKMRPSNINTILQQLYLIRQEANGVTSSFNQDSMGYYYDQQIARQTQIEIQVRMWLNHLPLLAHHGWANLYPFLLKYGKKIWSWVILSFLPFWITLGRNMTSFLHNIHIPTTWSLPPIKRSLIISSLLTLACTGFGSFFLLNWQHTPFSLVLLALCLLSSLVSFHATFKPTLPSTIRYGLATSAAIAFFTCLAILTQPSTQTLLMQISLSDLLSIVLITLALASLLQQPQTLPPTHTSLYQPRLEHLTLAITSFTCGVLAYNAAASLSLAAGSMPSLTSIVTISTFGTIAIIEFLSYHTKLSGKSWFLFALLVLTYTIASCLNLPAIFNMFPSPITTSNLSASDSLLVLLGLSFALLPLIISLAALGMQKQMRTHIIRFVIPTLVVACALQQHLLSARLFLINFSANQQHMYTLATKLGDIFSPNGFVATGLFLLALWLFASLFTRHYQPQLDYIGLLSIGLVFVLLQRSIPEDSVSRATTLFPETFTLPTFLYYFIPAIVLLLILALACLFVFLLFSAALSLAKKPHKLAVLVQWINPTIGYIVLFLCTLISLWLQWFFGNEEMLDDPSWMSQFLGGMPFTLPQLFFAISLLFFIASIFLLLGHSKRASNHTKNTFSGWTRFIILSHALLGAFLLLSMHKNTPLSLQDTLQWLHMPPFSIPSTLITLGLLLMASILFISSSHPTLYIVRGICLLAFLCILLQFLWPPFLLLALILLIPYIHFMIVALDS